MENFGMQYKILISGLKEAKGYNVIGEFDGRTLPNIQYITLEWLNKEDRPYNLLTNSRFIKFVIDFQFQTVKLKDYCHIPVSDEDHDKVGLCQAHLKEIFYRLGYIWFEEQQYSTIEELTDKISTFASTVQEILDKYTNGYPYIKLTTNLY